MTVTTSLVIQILASISTVIASWAYGSKRVIGPVMGLVSQVPWWALMVHDGLWGLLPVNMIMVLIHARNTIKWWKEK